jgi:hypothetical protein
MLKTVSPFQNVIGALVYRGTWNAATNNPTLVSGVGNKGDYYLVSVAGTTNLDGITSWNVGDWAVFDGTKWEKVDNNQSVTSVNGQTGVVVLAANDVGATANTTYINTGTGISGGGRLNGNVSISVGTVPVANVSGAVPNTVNVLAGAGLSGGGALTGNVTLSVGTIPVANVSGAVPNTVNVIAGTGLTGGGALTGNVTLAVGTVPVANISGLGTMATQNANAVAITGGTEANVSYSNVSISSGNATLTNITATRVTSNNIIATANTAPSSNVGAIQVGTNSFSDTGVIANFQSNVAGYNQVTIQNTSSASNASAEFIAYNNLGTAATNYATVGINSSTYSGSGSINAPGYGYFLSGSTDMVVGTISANAIHFVANSSPTDAMVVNANNTVTIQALSQSTSASATFATASLPLVPAGYITINLNGTNVKVPYYSV